MGALFSKLRIGEKILLSTGLIGLLLLGVIWQYHLTLEKVLTDYQQLIEVYGAKESAAREIESELWRARLAEREFLLKRDEELVPQVAERVQALRRESRHLAEVDPNEIDTTSQIDDLVQSHHQRFEAIVEAWTIRGLDENSGLQGNFRDSVHRLQAMAKTLNTDRLYLQLLQIRRGEKDLGLRREPQYRDKVLGLLDQFTQTLNDSELSAKLKTGLHQELETYRQAFLDYAGKVIAGEASNGGKGPFRQTAHRIEARLKTHYVPDLERNLLQLRRREKDYLLRHDPRYVTLAIEELDRISGQLRHATIPEPHHIELQGLLDSYRKDFLALVEQDRFIDTLLAQMDISAQQVIPLVQATVARTDAELKRNTNTIRDASETRSRLMLWVVLLVSILGLFLAFAIARHISARVVRMAGFLDLMAREQATDRLPEIPGARNEVDAMATSVNAMADHKDHLIAWWKTSMDEADAARALGDAINHPDDPETQACRQAETDLRDTIEKKDAHLERIHQELYQQAKRIVSADERLDESPGGNAADQQRAVIDSAARSIMGSLDILLSSQKISG